MAASPPNRRAVSLVLVALFVAALAPPARAGIRPGSGKPVATFPQGVEPATGRTRWRTTAPRGLRDRWRGRMKNQVDIQPVEEASTPDLRRRERWHDRRHNGARRTWIASRALMWGSGIAAAASAIIAVFIFDNPEGFPDGPAAAIGWGVASLGALAVSWLVNDVADARGTEHTEDLSRTRVVRLRREAEERAADVTTPQPE